MFLDKKEYIFTIAEEQNITRAAKKLYVAQSTLTMHLNRVENELGIKIFDRTKAPIVPTQAGKLYIEELKKIQAIEDHLLWSIEQIAHPQKQLSIGIGPVRSKSWIPRFLPTLEKTLTNTEFHVTDQGDEALIQGLISDQYDIVFGTMPVPDAQLTIVNLAYEEILLIIPESYQLLSLHDASFNSYAHPFKLNPSDLNGKPVIIPNIANDLNPYTTRTLEHYMIHPSKSIVISNMCTAASLVSQGLGYLFTTPSLLNANLPEELSHIHYCTLSSTPDIRTLIACYKSGNIKKDMIETVIKLVKELVLPYEDGLHLL